MGQATRVVMGLVTAGASELVQKKPFQPWQKSDTTLGDFGKFGADPIHGLVKAGSRLTKSPSRNPSTPETTAFMTELQREAQARAALSRKRREYQDVGRSSTILTGPGGLSGAGPGQQKSLLGL